MKIITKKIILIFLMAPIFLFAFNARAATVDANTALIVQLEQEIQSLIKQIIALLSQKLQMQTSTPLATNIISPQVLVQGQTQNNSGQAVLTVNAQGATAFVSINNGAQFAYVSPISLNNGDTYSVTASINNSTSKCNGTASSGGSYVCNINIASQ